MKKADFFPRAIAWIIDMGVLSTLIFATMIVFGLISGMAAKGESAFSGLLAGTSAIIMLALLILLPFLYFGYLWGQSGQSVGMKVMKIKVVRRNGEQQSFLRAAFRGSIGYGISGAVFYLGYLWALFDADEETWHDKIFDTQVVNI